MLDAFLTIPLATQLQQLHGRWEGVKVVHCCIDISPRSGLWNDKYRNHIVGQSTKRSVTINWNMNFPNRINCNLINYGIPICPILSILCMAFFPKKNVAIPPTLSFYISFVPPGNWKPNKKLLPNTQPPNSGMGKWNYHIFQNEIHTTSYQSFPGP